MELKILYFVVGVILLLLAIVLLTYSDKIKKTKLWPIAVIVYILAMANGISCIFHAIKNVPL